MNGKKRARHTFRPDLNPLEERVVLSSVDITGRAAQRQQMREQQQLLRQERAESRQERRLMVQEQRANRQHNRALLLQERQGGVNGRAARIAARASLGARSVSVGTPALATIQTSAASPTLAGNVRARNVRAALTQIPGARALPVSRGVATANAISSVSTGGLRPTRTNLNTSSVLNGNQIAAVNSFPSLITTGTALTAGLSNATPASGFVTLPTAPGTSTTATGVLFRNLASTPGSITTNAGTFSNPLTIPSFSNSTFNPLSGSALNTLNLTGTTGTLANSALNTTGTLNGFNPNILQSLQSSVVPLSTGLTLPGVINPTVTAAGVSAPGINSTSGFTNPTGINTISGVNTSGFTNPTGINSGGFVNPTGINTTGSTNVLNSVNSPSTTGLLVNPSTSTLANTTMSIPGLSTFANGTPTVFPIGTNVGTSSNTVFAPTPIPASPVL